MKKIYFLLLLLCNLSAFGQDFPITPQKLPINVSRFIKKAFGAQVYDFYIINVVGIAYDFLYLSDEKNIEIVITKDPKFTINGKNYWDIPYKDFPKEEKGYHFVYGYYFVKFDDGWWGAFGDFQPAHLLRAENRRPTPPADDAKCLYFVKTDKI